MMFPNYIAKTEIQNLPLLRFEGNIHLIDTEEELAKAIKVLSKEDFVGFDTETKPTFIKGEYNSTAIIQFATLTDAYLIRIKKMGLSDQLIRLLEKDRIQKVGISIRDDIKDLRRIRSFHPGGFMDLNEVAETMGITQIGVKSLAAIILKSRISKSQQTSNWENAVLSDAQKVYAATDAWVCIKMYDLLRQKGYLD